jgi:hypothetical protein
MNTRKFLSKVLALLIMISLTAASVLPLEGNAQKKEKGSCETAYNSQYTYQGNNIWKWARTYKCQGSTTVVSTCFFWDADNDPNAENVYDIQCP